MNFIFISPHFPKHYWNFCDRLKKNGVNVLGIGDSPYDALSDELKNALTEYYYLPHLDDYEQMVRAVGFFTFKYGKIDWIESNNEFWLEQDARLRTDFHVTTGEQYDHIDRIKNKSAMKAYYAKAGAPSELLAPWFQMKTISITHEEKLTEELFSRDVVDRIKTGYAFLLPYYDYFLTLPSDPEPETLK